MPIDIKIKDRQHDGTQNITACPVCSARMEHFSSIPAAAHLPELLRFKCRECGCFNTVEAPDGQAKAIAARREWL